MTEQELKPCPFCGGEETWLDDTMAPHYYQRNCVDCGAGPDHAGDWNTRPIEDELRKDLERLADHVAYAHMVCSSTGPLAVLTHLDFAMEVANKYRKEAGE